MRNIGLCAVCIDENLYAVNVTSNLCAYIGSADINGKLNLFTADLHMLQLSLHFRLQWKWNIVWGAKGKWVIVRL